MVTNQVSKKKSVYVWIFINNFHQYKSHRLHNLQLIIKYMLLFPTNST